MMTVSVANHDDNDSSTYADSTLPGSTGKNRVSSKHTTASLPDRRDSDTLMLEAQQEGVKKLLQDFDYDDQ
eukprot:CAMPEP_0185590426 /NCGR_PEP_ID=MMETSP0434-20130131/60742_1 /TAXON_ID=626734 ORGANISM="Favella taraikaensis, Strain Fe Narragansett Bay" /NCGR_SAMPLE_ID=MMETSP0434 /ASSEMBLY_ACC=CAM_ASM_000379 /LENGTH=70 /DNA_ID=CAMNT_0028214603 /DNA_START=209 /DNA_END=421 /DNA_ORIENTATION=-